MFTPAIHAAARAIEPSARGELEITDAIQYLVDDGMRVEPHIVKGWWKDTGRLEDMLAANRLVLETVEGACEGELIDSQVDGRVVIEPGARLERSHVRGPAIIGAGARLTDCYIGPYTAVGEGCVIENAEVEHSILLAGSSVRDLAGRMESSLLGATSRSGATSASRAPTGSWSATTPRSGFSRAASRPQNDATGLPLKFAISMYPSTRTGPAPRAAWGRCPAARSHSRARRALSSSSCSSRRATPRPRRSGTTYILLISQARSSRRLTPPQQPARPSTLPTMNVPPGGPSSAGPARGMLVAVEVAGRRT